MVMLFNTTFNNISAISWWSVLLETGVSGENHRPAARHRQTSSNKVVSSTPRHERDSNNTCSDCIFIEHSESKEEFEDIKGVIRIHIISKKNRQHNGQKKKYKRTNNDLQNIHIKLKIE
jgi:hypothetical protein